MRNPELSRALENFRRCTDEAPLGTYDEAKVLRGLIDNAMDDFAAALRGHGFAANNCDLAWELETALYAYVKQSNPDRTVFPTAEGFGEGMSGPARERVLAQSKGNLEALRVLGVV